MLKYIVGDLCEALASGEVDAIGHQANCFNTMNSGVAKAIRQRFPEAYEADCRTVKGDMAKFGDLSVATVQTELGWALVYNLYGQYDYGYDAKGYTDYEKLEQAMVAMRSNLLSGTGYYNIGFPKIGAGLGGGDWGKIAEIIDRVFGDDFQVNIYVLREEDKC